MRLSFEEIKTEIFRVFIAHGMAAEKAEICARIHTETTNDGIYSHGVGRVARFAEYLDKGLVDPNAEPSLEKEFGTMCVYNGNMGPGVLNALFAVEQGTALAQEHGLAMVGIKNTTHWMRGGTYALEAAKRGLVALMWTNTESVMPPWGAKDSRLGNNPFVLAMPRSNGQFPILFDMALSQYSFGKLGTMQLAGETLPFPGGFTENGETSYDPETIVNSRRVMPIGFWKGSGFSFMLDMLAAVLTDGNCVADIDRKNLGSCGGASQVMIFIDPTKMSSTQALEDHVLTCIDHLKSSPAIDNSRGASVPGEGVLRFRQDHAEHGIYVDDKIWSQIKAL